ncbi:MAG: Ku protein [Chloroflexi bacterium]|nr:Ku protein [Chloroflexota bacterium]
MPRAIWRGAITFGMVHIPVRLYTATESKDVSFRQLHREDHSRVRYLRWCPVDERELAPEEIVRGYEYAKDSYVVLEEGEFEGLPVASKHTITLAAFVEAAEIDPIYYEKSYYLEPDETGEKPFALLLRALEERALTGIAKIAIRNREQLCALRASGGAIVLETLLHADEIRPVVGEVGDVEVSDPELQMALALIEMMRQPFDPASYTDDYREALTALITAKLEGGEVVTGEVAAQPATQVVDLMAALRASVDAALAREDGGSSPSADEGDESGLVAAADGRGRSAGRREAAG